MWDFDEGEGRQSTLVLEVLLSYWLFWFLLLSEPEDGLNSYVFPLAILLVKGERLAQASNYLVSLFTRLDEWATDIVRSLRLYNLVTHANTSVLKMFLWEHFRDLDPKPIGSWQ